MPKKSDNRVRFTVSYLNRQLKPGRKIYRVYDQDPDRLCVRVLPSGKRVFEVVARINGNTKTGKICDLPETITAEQLSDVRARAREKLEAMTRDEDDHRPTEERLLFENVAAAFIKSELDRLRENDHRIAEFTAPRARWPENERRKMDAFNSFCTYLEQNNAALGAKAKPPIRYIGEIDKDLIDDFIMNYRYYNHRVSKSPSDLKHMSLSTRNKAASAFSTLMKWAVKNKLIVENKYLERTETPLPESDPIFLEEEEFDYMIDLLQAEYHAGDKATKVKAAAVLLFAFTGSRNTETIKMRWRDTGGKFDNYVDMQNMRLVYQDHKTRTEHKSSMKISMSSSAKALLKQLKEDVGTNGPYIFYSHQSVDGHIAIRTSNDFFKSRIRSALIKKFNWLEPSPGYDEPNPRNVRKATEITQYNLRHTLATLSLASGHFSIHEMQIQLKHKSPNTTMKYVGVSEKVLTKLSSTMR
jgi:integrase